MTPIKLTIPGHPLILKNSKNIIQVKGRRIVKSGPRVEAYQHMAIGEIITQLPRGFKTIGYPVSTRMLFFGAWKRGGGNNPDTSNLYQLPEDILQSARVIYDDNQIEHHDGSRRIFMCDICERRPRYKAGPNKGEFKPDCGAVKRCPFERVEITLMDA